MTLALQPGSTLLHYRVVAPLGAGGMGEVYRAVDATLGREVAIKVLPTAFALDAERLARFEREARLLASLNHPNIAAVYGLHELGGNRFLAMELVPGESLAQRLARGRVPVDEALAIARQIADALAAAHEQSVIHRDLKPANVQVTDDNRVKVLDFGLAKGLEPSGSGDLAHSPTLTFGATVEGVVLGTAAYMSPEQARGKSVDRRADVWAFGCVLWEMLSGRQLFGGETVSDTIASVLRSELDWRELPEETPAAVRRLLKRCLERDPAKRLRDLGDARLELDELAPLAASPTLPALAPAPASRATASRAAVSYSTAALWVAAAAAVALVSAWAVLRGRATAPPVRERPIRFALREPTLAVALNGSRIAISPAGDRLFWITERQGERVLVTRALSEVEAQPVSGSEGVVGIAAVAAEGDRVAVARGDWIEWLALRGGAPSRLARSPSFRGASLAEDGALWFARATESGIQRVGREGAEPEPIVAPDAGAEERSFRWPTLLPGGEIVLYTVATAGIDSFDEARIEAYSTRTKRRTIVVERATYPLFLAPDRLFFARSGGLFEARLDLAQLALLGEPRLVLEGVGSSPLTGLADVALARDGTLFYLAGGVQAPQRRLAEISRDGSVRAISSETDPYQWMRASPDGRTIAVDVDAAAAQIWLIERDRGTRVRLTDKWSNNFSVWRRDGLAVFYASGRGSRYHLFEQRLDGSAPRSILESETAFAFAPLDSSPDGTRLLLTASENGQAELAELALDGSGSARRVLAMPDNDTRARYSPDGRWIAFVSDESGRPEIYLHPIPGPGRKLRVSTDGGDHPVWSPDGTELLFCAGANGDEIHTAGVTLGTDPSVERPRRLFQLDAPVYNMDMLPDGKLVAVLFPAAAPAPPPLVVARGWRSSP